MAVLHRDHPCPACGHRHNFCDPQAADPAAKDYQAVCPECGARVRLRPERDGECVHTPPQGAVTLEPVGGAAENRP
jgi:hypothetical protein